MKSALILKVCIAGYYIFISQCKSIRIKNKYTQAVFVLPLCLLLQCRSSVEINPQNILTYLVKEPAVKANEAPLLILLHGYGSNEEDLFSLASYLPSNFRIISARAPIKIVQGSYAWYSLDMNKKPFVHNLEEANKAQSVIIQFIKAIKTKYKLNNNKILLAGFSQGGIMSYHVGLLHPQIVDGIGVMGGRMLPETQKHCKATKELRDLSIWIGHGVQDNILEIEHARSAYQHLQSISLKPTYMEYENAAHEINEKMLLDFIGWLRNNSQE